MSNKLPTHGFKWLSAGDMKKNYENRHNLNKIPCVLEVDLIYPKELHDSHIHYVRKGLYVKTELKNLSLIYEIKKIMCSIIKILSNI